jgi:large subunit ribosomal protein L22
MVQKDTKTYSTAYLQSVKTSPLKVTRVTGAVTGMKASEAVKYLSFCNLKMAVYIKSLILSALSNAENNHNMDIDELYVAKFDIGKAFTLKRLATRARGRSSRILKRFSNVRVYLAEK